MTLMHRLFSETTRENLSLLKLGITRIPMLFYVGARVTEVTPDRMVIRIPLKRRTKNHLNSMYFGALCAGADCAAGVFAMHYMNKQPANISLVFKDFHAEFLKRAEGDVDFICDQGKEISELVALAAASEERVEKPFEVTAIVPSISNEPVAKFKLMLSLKKRA